MGKVEITPSKFNGSVTLPPSKSEAHRALICSFLSGGGTVQPIIQSNDMNATIGMINALKSNKIVMDAIESGSTLRFMIPVVASLGREVIFIGEGSLLKRTIGEYSEILPQHGVRVVSNGGFLPVKISGRLKSGKYEVNGNISSQYITGLMIALANLRYDSKIVLKTPLQSKPYVDLTVKVLGKYGVRAWETNYGYFVKGGQRFKRIDYYVEGDWSQAAFFLVAGALNGTVEVKGLSMDSPQGDKAIVDVLRQFGADVEVKEDGVVCKKSRLKGCVVDAKNIPDLVPIIAVMAANAEGETIIKGAERLRYKESNRIRSVVLNLRAMGVNVIEATDGMIIQGQKKLKGAELDGFNDHRIVMAFSVAAANAEGKSVISDRESINKSYPAFFADFRNIGGRANVINDG